GKGNHRLGNQALHKKPPSPVCFFLARCTVLLRYTRSDSLLVRRLEPHAAGVVRAISPCFPADFNDLRDVARYPPRAHLPLTCSGHHPPPATTARSPIP